MKLCISYIYILFQSIIILSTFNKAKCEPKSYEFTSESDYYSLSVRMDPFRWLMYIDTYNDYSILYDYPGGDEWPQKVLSESAYLYKKETKTINNFDKQIRATEYETQLGLPEGQQLINVNIYYTEETGQDPFVWRNIPTNVKQLSLGFGLSHNSSFSFINQLYENKIINERKFSFEHLSSPHIIIGNRNVTSSYKYNETIILKDTDTYWGFPLNSITLNSMKYTIDKFAYINSALREDIASTLIYNVIKSFFTEQTQSDFNCKETTYRNKLTILCSNDEALIWPNMTINIGEGTSFSITLKRFFRCNEERCYLNAIIRNSDDNDNMLINIGKGFLSLFKLIEFDFDKPSITFHSNTIAFTKRKSHLINIKYLMIILSVILSLHIIVLLYCKFYLLHDQTKNVN